MMKVAHSPMKVLFQEGGESLIRETLSKLKGLRPKDNERENVENLARMFESGEISKLKERYKTIDSGIKEKRAKEEKSKAMEKKEKLERELETLKREVSDYRKEKGRISENRKELSESLESERKKLEAFVLEEINIKLKIIL